MRTAVPTAGELPSPAAGLTLGRLESHTRLSRPQPGLGRLMALDLQMREPLQPARQVWWRGDRLVTETEKPPEYPEP